MNLLELDEKCVATLEHTSQHQDVVKKWFEKRATFKAFRISDLVLMWDNTKERLGNHTKFQRLWIGPYQIVEILVENTFRLGTLDGEYLPLPVNGQFLKHHFQARIISKKKKKREISFYVFAFIFFFYLVCFKCLFRLSLGAQMFL